MSMLYALVLIASSLSDPQRLYATDTSHHPDEWDAHFKREAQKRAAYKLLRPFRVVRVWAQPTPAPGEDEA